MKITRKNLTLSNIKAFIQANKRILLEEHGPEFLHSPDYIQEQIAWRPQIANPQCIEEGQCVECLCSVPSKFYSDKACDGGCYPEMMDEDVWKEFKEIQTKNNLDIKVWKEVLQIMEDKKNKNMANNEFNAGTIKKGTKHNVKIPIHNPSGKVMTINGISASCGCVSFTPMKSVSPNNSALLPIEIDTALKHVADYDVWLTIRYNEIKRLNLQLKFKVIN